MHGRPFSLLLAAVCARASNLLDDTFARSPRGALLLEEKMQSAPEVPFVNFSSAYVAAALATPTNWTALGAVTPVKNQGAHGYCGTFGRVASAEGQFALRGGVLTSFSEEELIDCIGWDQDQFSYFAPKGFMTTAEYPYNLTGPDMDPPIPYNPCRYNSTKVVSGTQNFFEFSTGRAPSENQLVAFIHHNGPVSAGINADVFRLREKGCETRGDCFINATACASVPQEIDHSIAIVGYGTDPAHGDYWIIKNSWSEKFANSGYINVARGVGCAGMCGDPSICGNVFGHGDPKTCA